MTKRKWLLWALLVLLSPLVFGYGTVSAHEITEQELSQLETNLNKLKTNNENKQNLLNQQKVQLQEAQKQIQESKALNNQMQKSLESVNKYLTEYEKEMNHKMRVKERQLRTWKVIGAVLSIYVIKEKV